MTVPELPFNPFATSSVGDPWRSPEPDVKSINEPAFQNILGLLRQIGKTPHLAALVQGAAGSGKTHLIKRLVSEPGLNLIFVYVRPMHDHRRMFTRLLETVSTNLDYPMPNFQGQVQHSQLDLIVAHIVKGALVDYSQRHPGLVGPKILKAMAADALNALKLKQGKHWEKVCAETKRFLKDFSLLETAIPEKVVDVLFAYVDPSKRKAVATYLSGGVPDTEDCQALGLSFSEPDMTVEAQEDRSKQILKSLGLLLHFYRPMILCFDQLENLNTNELIQGLGIVLSELVDRTENILPVAFVRPDTWQQRLAHELDESVRGRLETNVLELEGCNLSQAMELVQARLAWAYEGVADSRPNEYFPLDRKRLEEALRKGGKSPRDVIITANRLLGTPIEVEDPLQVLRQVFDAEKEKLLNADRKEPARKETLVTALHLYFRNRGPQAPYRVKGLNLGTDVDLTLKVKRAGQRGHEVCSVGIVVETAVHYRPLTATFEFLRSRIESKISDFAFVLRDERNPIPPKPGGMPATVQKLKAFEQAGGLMRYIGYEDLAHLYALVYIADHIGSGDITYTAASSGRREAVGEKAFTDFVRGAFHCRIVSDLEKQFLAPSDRRKTRRKPDTGEKKASLVKKQSTRMVRVVEEYSN